VFDFLVLRIPECACVHQKNKGKKTNRTWRRDIKRRVEMRNKKSRRDEKKQVFIGLQMLLSRTYHFSFLSPFQKKNAHGL